MTAVQTRPQPAPPHPRHTSEHPEHELSPTTLGAGDLTMHGGTCTCGRTYTPTIFASTIELLHADHVKRVTA